MKVIILLLCLLLAGCGDVGSSSVDVDQNVDSTCEIERGDVDCDRAITTLTCGGEIQAFIDASCEELDAQCGLIPDRCDELEEENEET
jgi:hypothetical protein